LPIHQPLFDGIARLLRVQRLLPDTQELKGGNVKHLLHCPSMMTSFEKFKCDAVRHAEGRRRLLGGESLVLVDGEVFVLQLLAKLGLDFEVFLVGSEGIGGVEEGAFGAVFGTRGGCDGLQVFLNFLVFVILDYAVQVVQQLPVVLLPKSPP
jgi:hypothetical protein